MQRPKKITVETIRLSIAKIKRRKGIKSDADISIVMIASEAGCSRQTLYSKEFDGVLLKYKKIKGGRVPQRHP